MILPRFDVPRRDRLFAPQLRQSVSSETSMLLGLVIVFWVYRCRFPVGFLDQDEGQLFGFRVNLIKDRRQIRQQKLDAIAGDSPVCTQVKFLPDNKWCRDQLKFERPHVKPAALVNRLSEWRLAGFAYSFREL